MNLPLIINTEVSPEYSRSYQNEILGGDVLIQRPRMTLDSPDEVLRPNVTVYLEATGSRPQSTELYHC